MGIVLPDSILGSPGLGYILEWMIQNHRIVASIDLHADTFQPRNGTQTSVLILQKKTQEQRDAEEKSGKMADYNIFMAMVEKVGHDKRGNPLFKRDKEGNEILVPDTNSVLVLGETGDGQRTVSHEQKVKVEDDQTPDVPAIFAEWKKQEGLGWQLQISLSKRKTALSRKSLSTRARSSGVLLRFRTLLPAGKDLKRVYLMLRQNRHEC